ncbi:MAG: hypothetical protein ACC645_27365 [Pirellulales bacterium]
MRRVHCTWLVLCIVCSMLVGNLHAQSFEREPINYGKGPWHDPVAQLQERIDAGAVSLKFDDKHGYLASVLEALKVPVSSQVLVFSKTSFQQRRISPDRPRSVYFSDNVYVGWVQQGEVVELSAVDPQQGAIFYSLKQQPQQEPRFTRHVHDCLQCHASSLTAGVPGHLVRSVYPDVEGHPILSAGSFITDPSSPLKERWGGWYVSGTHGRQRHMGNSVMDDDEDKMDMDQGANVTDLGALFPTEPYLTPHSDLVALMVLEHETQMHNALTSANFESRMAMYDAKVINGMLGRPADHLSDSTHRRLDRAAERLLKALLLVGEIELTAPVKGTSGFSAEFMERGPWDNQWRSLREFDLQHRLFKYPCSYLIYSEAFDGLPQPLRERVYARLHEILTGRDTSDTYTHLSAADRTAIVEILQDTKPELAEAWAREPRKP